MTSVFPAEMYKDDLYRVVHGPEEAAKFASEGWTENIPNDKKRADYKVHHHKVPAAPAAKAGK